MIPVHVPPTRNRSTRPSPETPCSVADLDAFWSGAGIDHGIGRASLAWMIKYDLLRALKDDRPEGGFQR